MRLGFRRGTERQRVRVMVSAMCEVYLMDRPWTQDSVTDVGSGRSGGLVGEREMVYNGVGRC